MRRILLALLLCLAPRAWAVTVTFTGSGNWTAVGTYTGTCPACPATGADAIVINSGVVATCPTGVLPATTDVVITTGSITINAGGTLAIQDGCAIGVGAGGIINNGTMTMNGKVLTYGTASPVFTQTALESSSAATNTALPLGRIVPCPVLAAGGVSTDCTLSTSRQLIGLCWPDTDTPTRCLAAGNPDPCCTGVGAGALCTAPGYNMYAAGGGQQFYVAWLAALAVGDIVTFWDPSGGLDPSRDVNAMYKITSVANVGSAANRCIFVSALQSSGAGDEMCDTRDDVPGDCTAANQPFGCCTGVGTAAAGSWCAAGNDERARNCTQAQREIQECTVSAAVAPGSRVITCTNANTSIALFAKEHIGRWLTCTNADTDGDGTGDFVTVTQRVTNSTDGGAAADTLTLMPGGFPYNIPTNSKCYLDLGWMTGDVISVFRPAELDDGDATVGNGIVDTGGGTITASFAHLFNRGQLLLKGASDLDNTLIIEPSTTLTTEAIWHLWNSSNTFTRLNVIGARKIDAHGVMVGGSGFTPTFEDSVFRYMVDDNFLPNGCTVSGATCTPGPDNTAGTTYGLNLKRDRFEFAGGGCNGGSLQANCVGQPCLNAPGPSTCGGSGGMYDTFAPTATRPVALTATDILCVSCNDPDGSEPYTPGGTGTSTAFTGLVLLGVNGPISTPNVADTVASNSISNLLSVDQTFWYANTAFIQDVTSLADATIEGPSFSHASGGLTAASAVLPVVWNRVLIRNASLIGTATLLQWGTFSDNQVTVNDLALIQDTNAGGGVAFNIGGAGGYTKRIDINGLTIGFRRGKLNPSWVTPWAWDGDDTVFNTLRTAKNLLFVNGWYSGGASNVNGNVTGADADGGAVGLECVVNHKGGISGAIGSGPWFYDTEMPFTNPDKMVFVPTAQSAPARRGLVCGARNSGARKMWATDSLHYSDTMFSEGLTWQPKGGGGSRRNGPRATP